MKITVTTEYNEDEERTEYTMQVEDRGKFFSNALYLKDNSDMTPTASSVFQVWAMGLKEQGA